MRNLKRALSLALASVMLLGMMVVGTGASYADVTSEDNKEAIEVLQTIGVMVGDNNGNFNPDAMVTREQMAVIMCNLLDYTVSTYKGTTKFTDVSSWALPYVEACYTNGIIAGYSETQFGGNDSVTTSQAALMILKALGYFQERGDFGSDWVVSTIRVGAQAELFDGVDNGANEALTRNDVAQIVLNALKAECVEIGSHDLVADGNGGFTTKAVYTARTSTNDKYKAIVDEKADGASRYSINLGEELYNGTLGQDANTTDDFGRPATKWSYKSTAIGTFADRPIATYTAKASKGTLYDLVGSSVVSDLGNSVAAITASSQDTLAVYVDGDLQTGHTKAEYFDRNSSGSRDSGKGVLTEVYLDNDGNVTLVYVNTYLMQATNDYNENKGTINVTAKTKPTGFASTPTALDVDDFAAIADLKADDYILYTASSKGGWSVKSVAKAEVVTGTVDAYNNEATGFVTIEGTQYDYALKAASDTSNGYLVEYNVTDTASVVVDANGYVLYVDNASISVGNYVYITEAAPSATVGNKVIAEAIFADGTIETITVDKLYLRESRDSLATKVDSKLKDDAESIESVTPYGQWFAYTKNSKGEYTLKEAATSYLVAGSGDIQNGKVVIDNTYYGDKNTVFVVYDSTNNKVQGVYTGITNVPNVDDAKIVAMNKNDKDAKAASLVYVSAAKTDIDNASTDDLLYVLKKTSQYVDTTDKEVVYVWDVILNGTKTSVETKETWTAKSLYTDYSVDGDGYYEHGASFNGAIMGADDEYLADTLTGASIALSGDTLTINGKTYVVTADTKINLVLYPAAAAGTPDILRDQIMTDNAATYELTEGISASALKGLFDGFTVSGSVQTILVDDESKTDLVDTMFITVTSAAVAP